MSGRVQLAPSSQEHQTLVSALAKGLRDQWGLRLWGVAHDYYEDKPWEIGGFVPDVIAYDEESGLYVIGEAKTCDDIDNEDTRDQIKAWTNVEVSDGKSKGVKLPVHIMVPPECRSALQGLLRNLGVRDKVRIW